MYYFSFSYCTKYDLHIAHEIVVISMNIAFHSFTSFQFSLVTQSCPTFCDSRDCSTPGLPIQHQFLEVTQTHVHWVGDAVQLSHLLLSPLPSTFNLSQQHGLFKWISSSHQGAKVLEFQLQHQSFQWISGLISFRMDWLDLLAVQGALKSLLQRFTHGGLYMSMVPFQFVSLFCCVHVWSLYLCKYCLKRYIWNLKNDTDELIYWAGI